MCRMRAAEKKTHQNKKEKRKKAKDKKGRGAKGREEKKGRKRRRGEKGECQSMLTDLPEHNSSLNGPDNQHISSEGQASYPLGKGYKSLLVPTHSRVDMYICLLMLSGENMGITDGQAVKWCCALLEGRFCSKCRPKRVSVDGDIFGDGCVACQWRATDRREELLCHHLVLFCKVGIWWLKLLSRLAVVAAGQRLEILFSQEGRATVMPRPNRLLSASGGRCWLGATAEHRRHSYARNDPDRQALEQMLDPLRLAKSMRQGSSSLNLSLLQRSLKPSIKIPALDIGTNAKMLNWKQRELLPSRQSLVGVPTTPDCE